MALNHIIIFLLTKFPIFQSTVSELADQTCDIAKSKSNSKNDPPKQANMDWRCSSNTNAGLLKNMFESGIVKNEAIYQAMSKVDRAHFVPDGTVHQGPTALADARDEAYNDNPIRISDRATISAPHMHAHSLSILEDFLKPGMRALDVGSGSGYLTAIMSKMVDGKNQNNEQGYVVGIDYLQYLTDLSIYNCKKDSENSLIEGVPDRSPASAGKNMYLIQGGFFYDFF